MLEFCLSCCLGYVVCELNHELNWIDVIISWISTGVNSVFKIVDQLQIVRFNVSAYMPVLPRYIAYSTF